MLIVCRAGRILAGVSHMLAGVSHMLAGVSELYAGLVVDKLRVMWYANWC